METLQRVGETCFKKIASFGNIDKTKSLVTRKVKMGLNPVDINNLKKRKLRVQSFATPEYSVEAYKKRIETESCTNLCFKQLSEEISKLQKCKEVNLDLVSCFKVTEKSLNFLVKKLVELVSLQNLHLTISGEISKEGLRIFATHLSKLRRLKRLSISFWNPTTNMTDNVIAFLGRELSKLNELTEITLDFWSCPLITDDGIARLSKKLSHLRKLEHLSVNFWRACEIKQEGIDALKKTTARLPKLTKLQIYTPKFELLSLKDSDNKHEKHVNIKKFLQYNRDVITGNVHGFKNNLLWLFSMLFVILGISAFFN